MKEIVQAGPKTVQGVVPALLRTPLHRSSRLHHVLTLSRHPSLRPPPNPTFYNCLRHAKLCDCRLNQSDLLRDYDNSGRFGHFAAVFDFDGSRSIRVRLEFKELLPPLMIIVFILGLVI